MKAKQRKLIPAIAMLVVAAVTLTSASYAWFTMSREVTATGIQLTAKAPTNLLIASGKDAWSDTNVGGYDSTTKVNMTAENVGKLIPASSRDGLEFHYPDTTTADRPTDATKFSTTTDKAVSGKDTSGYFIDIPLWFKNTGDDEVKVVLKTVQGGTSSADNVTKITGTEGADAPTLYKSARFALLNDTGVKLADATNYMYKSADAAYLGEKEGVTINGPVKKSEADGTVSYAYKSTGDDCPWLNLNSNDNNLLITVPAKTDDVKITVRVWLEGQDASCVTAQLEGKININLVFADQEYAKAPTA